MAAPAEFSAYAAELDEHYDRRERIIKASRDITALSKKVVFLLHRHAGATGADPQVARARAVDAAQPKLAEIQALFGALRPELADGRFWRYAPSVSPGVQEYIEALSFSHYLATGTLISLDAAQRTLSDADGPFFPLTVSDYLLGLADLTGELMRLAVPAIAQRGARRAAADVCAFVRGAGADLEPFAPRVRELHKKGRETAASLRKIEDAAYAIAIRESEFDLAPERLDALLAQIFARPAREAEHEIAVE